MNIIDLLILIYNCRQNRRYYVRASKEVILAAGSISSPQILMLSGVGPQSELQKYRIPVLQNLPVGQNLLDHPTYYGLNLFSNHSEPNLPISEYVRQYLNGVGPYAVAGNNHGVGFFQTLTNVPGLPDLEMMIVPSNRTTEFFQKNFGLTNETLKAMTKNVKNNSTFTIYLVCLHPKSVGNVTLKSNSPFDYPLINSNFLEDPHDIEVLYRAVLLVKELLKTSPMKAINATMEIVDFPACRSFVPDTKQYWYCALRQMTMNLYHPMGTAKMSPRNKEGVVDSQLRVYGIRKLRVADASIIPFTSSAHPVAPVTMIAEKLADIIKRDYL